jgi:hypothetical protein
MLRYFPATGARPAAQRIWLICWAVAGVLLRLCCEYRLLRQVSTEFFVTTGAGRLPAVTPWAWQSTGPIAKTIITATTFLIVHLLKTPLAKTPRTPR